MIVLTWSFSIYVPVEFILLAADHVVRSDHVTLFKDFWDWRLRESPELATSLGLSDYDDRLESFTVEALRHRKVELN